MAYIGTPLSFTADDTRVAINRNVEERIQMLDNLIELIVFTPRGSFNADPDFGFEYWNHEYSNVRFRDFNNDHLGGLRGSLYSDVTRKECQESILNSLATYYPQLKHAEVSIELNMADENKQKRKKVLSKYFVNVRVMGLLDDGLGTTSPYEKQVVFLMEPTAKQYRI